MNAKTRIAYAVVLLIALAYCLSCTAACSVEFKEDVLGQGDFQSNTDVGITNQAQALNADLAYGQIVKFEGGGNGGGQAFFGLNFSGQRGSWTASSPNHYLRAYDCSYLNATANIYQIIESEVTDNKTSQFSAISTLIKAEGFGKFREKIIVSGGSHGRPIELSGMRAAGLFKIASSTKFDNSSISLTGG